MKITSIAIMIAFATAVLSVPAAAHEKVSGAKNCGSVSSSNVDVRSKGIGCSQARSMAKEYGRSSRIDNNGSLRIGSYLCKAVEHRGSSHLDAKCVSGSKAAYFAHTL